MHRAAWIVADKLQAAAITAGQLSVICASLMVTWDLETADMLRSSSACLAAPLTGGFLRGLAGNAGKQGCVS